MTNDVLNRVEVRAGVLRYAVLIGTGFLASAGAYLSSLVRGPQCAVISDEKVALLLADEVIESLTSAGFKPTLITVPAGEQSKSLQVAGEICEKMAMAGLDRTSFVVAVGGGMVGDLAGFVAAIYHRGIPWVNVPTTLLAMVDSSIGGKTAVNISAGKNLVGAWHQPALVLSDVETLATLPPREFKQGFAEMIKHSVIRDAEMLEMLENVDRTNLTELVRRNVEIKAAIVAADERETTGERALLNFGHTVGHAIERAGGYRDFLHGEAVSLGMVAAAEISVRKAGLPEADRQKILRTLRAFELPTNLPTDSPREKILDAIRFDKKFQRGEIRFVVTPVLGSARVASDVTLDDLSAAVGQL